MRNLIFIVISLVSSLAVLGCAGQASPRGQASKKIVISYSTIIYPEQ